MAFQLPFLGADGCPTGENSLSIGVGVASDLQCSGRGDCVSALCVCDRYWTGVSDLYNLDGLDCQVFRPLEQFMWAVYTLVWLISFKNHLIAIRYQLQQYRAKKTGEPMRKFVPLRFAVRSLFAVTCMLVFGVMKLVGEYSIGRDAEITIVYVVGTEVSMWIVVESQTKAFEILFKTLGASKQMDTLLARFKTLYSVISACTLVARTVVTLAGVVFPAQTFAYMWLLSILRNLFSMGYFLASFLAIRMVANSAQNLVASMSKDDLGLSPRAGDSSQNGAGGGGKKRKVQRVIESLRDSSHDSRKKTALAVILYAIWCTPQLYGHQGMLWVFLLILSAGKSHNINWYLPKGENGKVGVGGTSEGVTRSATGTAGSSQTANVVPYGAKSPDVPTVLMTSTFDTNDYTISPLEDTA